MDTDYENCMPIIKQFDNSCNSFLILLEEIIESNNIKIVLNNELISVLRPSKINPGLLIINSNYKICDSEINGILYIDEIEYNLNIKHKFKCNNCCNTEVNSKFDKNIKYLILNNNKILIEAKTENIKSIYLKNIKEVILLNEPFKNLSKINQGLCLINNEIIKSDSIILGFNMHEKVNLNETLINGYKIKLKYSKNEFEIIKKIGSGGFSNVFSIKDIYNNKYAIKIANKKKYNELANELYFYSKLYFYSNKTYNNKKIFIPRFYGFDIIEINKEKFPCIILELADGLLIPNDINSLILQASAISNTLDIIYFNGLKHCDIKPNNILVKNNYPMLIDFGGCININEWSLFNNTITDKEEFMYNCYTKKYADPLIKDYEKTSIKNEVFSFALTIQNLSNKLQSNKLKKILNKCFDKHLDNRPNFKTLSNQLISLIDSNIASLWFNNFNNYNNVDNYNQLIIFRDSFYNLHKYFSNKIDVDGKLNNKKFSANLLLCYTLKKLYSYTKDINILKSAIDILEENKQFNSNNEYLYLMFKIYKKIDYKIAIEKINFINSNSIIFEIEKAYILKDINKLKKILSTTCYHYKCINNITLYVLHLLSKLYKNDHKIFYNSLYLKYY